MTALKNAFGDQIIDAMDEHMELSLKINPRRLQWRWPSGCICSTTSASSTSLSSNCTTSQLGMPKQRLKSPSQHNPLRDLLLAAVINDIIITPKHTPGDENGLANVFFS